MKTIGGRRSARSLWGALGITVFFLSTTPAYSAGDALGSLNPKGSLAELGDSKYRFFGGLGVTRYSYDKPGKITDNERRFFKSQQPSGTFTSDVDSSGLGITATVGGEMALGDDMPSADASTFLGWFFRFGTLPSFSVMEKFDFAAAADGGVENRRIRGDLELDGGLTYGLGLTARWQWGGWSFGPQVSYDWYNIDLTNRARLLVEQGGAYQEVDSSVTRDDLDDSGFGYGAFVGLDLGGGNGGSPLQIRLGYGNGDVKGSDIERFSFSVQRWFGYAANQGP